jgi:hypothetical protein
MGLFNRKNKGDKGLSPDEQPTTDIPIVAPPVTAAGGAKPATDKPVTPAPAAAVHLAPVTSRHASAVAA